MSAHYAICPITGLEIVPCIKTDETFNGHRYFIPSISEKLLVSISNKVLLDRESRSALIEHREKFIKNLQMISELRQETYVSLGNWWLFVK
ncbi:hypothetical protein Runsl_4820 [Runella slithyformis DSM 19594]|uniref:Uncharacterized protein n=1 Tax=Runella slithyformis (strain ATCC 29530 / DSM 19594 / LMG 11500 / NCIMB 11436 / LSU 4) TaxID=761193 RepID=A0A7U4E8A2_RUNSL|nr:hypothetical protein Runsl_4820 [Runella slithyformis DSM 19594]